MLTPRNAHAKEQTPLHRRIRRDIETQIMAGVLKPGDRIPFEHELMRQYECSRMTVNKALSALAATGLIGRQRGAGSVVAQPRIHMAALAIPDIQEEIVKRGFRYQLTLVTREIVPGSSIDEQQMRLPRGVDVLSLRCLHIADQRVFAVEDRLISLDAVPEASDVDFSRIPPGSWLLAHVPWTEAEHKILAAQACELASVLNVEPQTACLILERNTWRAGRSITHVRQTFPADCFDLTARFISEASMG
ncbi:UTRA domain-containing protein [Sphingomonas sp. KC8]|uniref:UTRA domain-containing protein n=1 Tax=Sphingomonas sp. KC8 TaxID=1030157 RepID=UPI0002489C68|nr:UTRA domain-containing protein [Sphingomonas sp. KC8]ARS29350.1 GntR family transcriptional regulator [Sphingomonas sp. KC8]